MVDGLLMREQTLRAGSAMIRKFVAAFSLLAFQAAGAVPAFAQRPMQVGVTGSSVRNVASAGRVSEPIAPAAEAGAGRVLKFALIGGLIGGVAGAVVSYAISRKSQESEMAYAIIVPLGTALGVLFGALEGATVRSSNLSPSRTAAP
jgi:hypothetical protein